MWNAVLEAGKAHNLKVIAPAHHRRVAAGILSWGQDMDAETLPFQVNLGYQVPRTKEADYIGKAALERARDAASRPAPRRTRMTMVGMRVGGKPIDEYAPDFWLVRQHRRRRAGRLPDLAVVVPGARVRNIALGYVPVELAALGTELAVDLPDQYADTPGTPGRRRRWSRFRSGPRSTRTSASCSRNGASTPRPDARECAAA